MFRYFYQKGSDPMTDIRDIQAALEAPFPDVYLRTGARNTAYEYIAYHDVLVRVIQADPAYGWDIREVSSFLAGSRTNRETGAVTEIYAIRVVARLTIAGVGRDAIGTAVCENEDSYKAACTDAFKSAARLFGIGIQVLPSRMENAQKKVPRQARAQNSNAASKAAPAQSTPAAQQAPVSQPAAAATKPADPAKCPHCYLRSTAPGPDHEKKCPNYLSKSAA